MNFDKDTKIRIVGLGLIGGSYAQGLSEAGFEVGAIDRKQTSIDFALEHGFIKHGRTGADPDYIKDFDLLVFALYPHIFINWIKENQQYIKSGALLTDVTGVKSGLAEEIQSVLRPDLEFIGAHPMAELKTRTRKYSSARITSSLRRRKIQKKRSGSASGSERFSDSK